MDSEIYLTKKINWNGNFKSYITKKWATEQNGYHYVEGSSKFKDIINP